MQILWKNILFLFLLILILPLPLHARILITEVMYNVKGSDNEREWIEVINLGPDIEVKTGRNGWKLFDGKKNRILKGENFIFKKGEVLLFVNNRKTFESEYAINPNIKLIECSFVLNNKGGIIKILDENKNVLAEFPYDPSLGGNGNNFSLINENGFIKEGRIEKGSPGIYPEPEDQKLIVNNLEKVEKNKTLSDQIVTTTINLFDNTKEGDEDDSAKESMGETNSNQTKDSTKQENLYHMLIINEFFPNPKGKDEKEFIEIFNPNNQEINLEEIILKVGNKKIKLSGTIKPQEYKVFTKEDFKFNIRNKGEEISLLSDKNNKEIFYIKYEGKSYEDKSFARDDNGQWSWTIPTPGKPNVFLKEDNIKEKEEMNENQVLFYNEGYFESDEEKNPSDIKNMNFSANLKSNIFSSNIKPLFIGFFLSLLIAGALFFLKFFK